MQWAQPDSRRLEFLIRLVIYNITSDSFQVSQRTLTMLCGVDNGVPQLPQT